MAAVPRDVPVGDVDEQPGVVVVVGANLAGLTAALQLCRLRVPVRLFSDGQDRGPAVCRLYERGAAAVGLKSLGVEPAGTRYGSNGGVAIYAGRTHMLPVGYCSLLSTGLLGLVAKRELASFMARVPSIDLDELQDVPLDRWIASRIADPLARRMALACARIATSTDEPTELSAAAAVAQLQLSLAGGVRVLMDRGDALRQALLGRLGDEGILLDRLPLAAVEMDGGRARGVRLASGGSVDARAVVVATDPAGAARLLGSRTMTRSDSRPVSAAVLSLSLTRLPRPHTRFAVGIDQPVSYWSASTAEISTPGVDIQVAKHRGAGGAGVDNDEAELERLLDLLQPGWRALVIARRFDREVLVASALVSARAGGFRGRPGSDVPGVGNAFLAGDWVGPTGQLADAAVASGLRAARAAAHARETH